MTKKRFRVGMKVRVQKLEIEGFIVAIKGHNVVICDEYFKMDTSDAYISTTDVIQDMRRANKSGKCTHLSGITELSDDVEVLEKVPKEWQQLSDLDYSGLSEEFKKYTGKYSGIGRAHV